MKTWEQLKIGDQLFEYQCNSNGRIKIIDKPVIKQCLEILDVRVLTLVTENGSRFEMYYEELDVVSDDNKLISTENLSTGDLVKTFMSHFNKQKTSLEMKFAQDMEPVTSSIDALRRNYSYIEL